MTDQLKQIILKLKDRISQSVHFQEDLNEASWGRETGILITRNDANVIVSELEKPTYTKDRIIEILVTTKALTEHLSQDERNEFFEKSIKYWEATV